MSQLNPFTNPPLLGKDTPEAEDSPLFQTPFSTAFYHLTPPPSLSGTPCTYGVVAGTVNWVPAASLPLPAPPPPLLLLPRPPAPSSPTPSLPPPPPPPPCTSASPCCSSPSSTACARWRAVRTTHWLPRWTAVWWGGATTAAGRRPVGDSRLCGRPPR